jgi:integrase/recombinase XerD
MDTIDEWINIQKANNLDEGTLKTYRSALLRVNNYKPLDEMTKKDLIDYFAKFDKSESLKLLTSIVIKRFFRDTGKPDIVDWLKIEKPADNFDPKDVLTQEDIEVMIEAADSHYFKAMLAFLWDTGCRWSEAHLIKWGDLIDTTEGFEAHVPTKKKKNGGYAFRKMFLAESSKYLRNHQISAYSNSNDLIFGMTYRAEFEMLNHVKEKINTRINKPITFHKIRHARATHLTKFNVNDDYMRKMFGWSPTSTVPSRYKHLSDEDVVNMQKSLLGKGHSEPPKPRPILEPPPLKLQNMAETLFELKDKVEKQENIIKIMGEVISSISKKGIPISGQVSQSKTEYMKISE